MPKKAATARWAKTQLSGTIVVRDGDMPNGPNDRAKRKVLFEIPVKVKFLKTRKPQAVVIKPWIYTSPKPNKS